MAKGNRDESLDRHKVTDASKLSKMSASFAEAKHLELDEFPAERAIIYQIQKLNDEVKELHRFLGAEVSTNVTTNLSVTTNASSLTINSSDGTNASIPAATTSSWGALSNTQAAQVENVANNTLKGSSVGYYPAKVGNYVWIPATQFYGEHTVLGKNTYITQTGTKSVSSYEWPGMFGKKVIEVKAWTDSAALSAVSVSRITATTGSAALLGTGNTLADIDITDWGCAMGETLKIEITLKSTTNKLYGIHLKIDDA